MDESKPTLFPGEPTGLKLCYFGDRSERPARPGFVAMWPETFKPTDVVMFIKPYNKGPLINDVTKRIPNLIPSNLFCHAPIF